MVTCTIFINHLFEVGLTQNQETMALRMLIIIIIIIIIVINWALA
jgi:hypothetical protein